MLCLASAAIAIAVAANWHPKSFLALAIVLNLAYWVLAQGFGGIFEGGATDPNAGPLFVLLALAMWGLIPYGQRESSGIAQSPPFRDQQPQMSDRTHFARLGAQAAMVLAAGLLFCGCAAADKNAAPTISTSTSSSAMAGMQMSTGSSGSSAVAAMSVDGIKPIPTQVLASTTWQGMKITAQAMTAVPFVVYNGTKETEIKPGPKTSFHLMVMLNDAHTNVPIPYATVWATISKEGHIYYDDRQWPMLSAYMGPHYGNNVSVPGAGTYQLSLLISPPVSARHMEYAARVAETAPRGPHLPLEAADVRRC